MRFRIFLFCTLSFELGSPNISSQNVCLTVFKKPSKISVTCSGLNDPTNKIKGIDDSDTYPPQSIESNYNY
jgi:hypothetical protein